MKSRPGAGNLTAFALPALGLLLMAAACRQERTAGRPVESVERVYELHCLGCHGSKGEGAWGSNIQGLKSPVGEIARVIAKGEGKMPGYEGHLTEAEINALAEHVKGFKMDTERSPAP